MSIDVDGNVPVYLERLSALYADVRRWLGDKGVEITEDSIEIYEAEFGRYNAPRLSIRKNQGGMLAEIRPVGASIIAADGRADIVGTLDTQSLVYFHDGGPQVDVTQDRPDGVVVGHRPMFRGVDMDGWYWMEEKRFGRVRRLDESLLLDLLAEVSDYVF